MSVQAVALARATGGSLNCSVCQAAEPRSAPRPNRSRSLPESRWPCSPGRNRTRDAGVSGFDSGGGVSTGALCALGRTARIDLVREIDGVLAHLRAIDIRRRLRRIANRPGPVSSSGTSNTSTATRMIAPVSLSFTRMSSIGADGRESSFVAQRSRQRGTCGNSVYPKPLESRPDDEEAPANDDAIAGHREPPRGSNPPPRSSRDALRRPPATTAAPAPPRADRAARAWCTRSSDR